MSATTHLSLAALIRHLNVVEALAEYGEHLLAILTAAKRFENPIVRASQALRHKSSLHFVANTTVMHHATTTVLTEHPKRHGVNSMKLSTHRHYPEYWVAS
jgi:uncharacterized membrane protein YjjP (DUF1212 family)